MSQRNDVAASPHSVPSPSASGGAFALLNSYRHRAQGAAGGLIMLAVAGWAGQARGQPGQDEGERGSGWSLQITPYVWMIGIEGDLATLSGLPPRRRRLELYRRP